MGGGVIVEDPYDNFVYHGYPSRESWLPGYNLAAPRRRSNGSGYYHGLFDGSSYPNFGVEDIRARDANLTRERQQKDYQGVQTRRMRRRDGNSLADRDFAVPPSNRLRPTRSSASPSTRNSSKPSIVSIPVVQVNETSSVKSPGRSDEGMRKKLLSMEDAAVRLQSRFRGFLVRRTQPLSHLRTVAKVRSKLRELKKQASAANLIELARVDTKARVTLTEAVMSLLLQLDAIQGAHSVVREFRKSATKEVIGFQEEIDDLLSGKTEAVQVLQPSTERTTSFENSDQSVAGTLAEEAEEKHGDEAEPTEGLESPEGKSVSVECFDDHAGSLALDNPEKFHREDKVEALLADKTEGSVQSTVETVETLDHSTCADVEGAEGRPGDEVRPQIEDAADTPQSFVGKTLSVENCLQLRIADVAHLERRLCDEVGDESDIISVEYTRPKVDAEHTRSGNVSEGAEVEEVSSSHSVSVGTNGNAKEVTSRLSTRVNKGELLPCELSEEVVAAVDTTGHQFVPIENLHPEADEEPIVRDALTINSRGNLQSGPHSAELTINSQGSLPSQDKCSKEYSLDRDSADDINCENVHEGAIVGTSDVCSNSSPDSSQPALLPFLKSNVDATVPCSRDEDDKHCEIVFGGTVGGIDDDDTRTLLLNLSDENRILKSMLGDIMSCCQLQTIAMQDMKNRLDKIESELSLHRRREIVRPIQLNDSRKVKWAPTSLHNVRHRLEKLERQSSHRKYKKLEKHRQRKLKTVMA